MKNPQFRQCSRRQVLQRGGAFAAFAFLAGAGITPAARAQDGEKVDPGEPAAQ